MVNEKLYMVAALKISTENLGRKSLRNRLVAHCSLLRAQSLPPKQGDRGGLSWLTAKKSPPKQGGCGVCSWLMAHGLELCVPRRAWEGNHVAYVLHAGDEEDETLET